MKDINVMSQAGGDGRTSQTLIIRVSKELDDDALKDAKAKIAQALGDIGERFEVLRQH